MNPLIPSGRAGLFLQEMKDLGRDGRRAEDLRGHRPGRLDLKGEGVEGQAGKSSFLAEKRDGPGGAVATVARHGVAGEPGVATDLVLAARQEFALDECVSGTPPEDPESGLARNGFTGAFGMETAAGLL
jgi:hypothetical protein